MLKLFKLFLIVWMISIPRTVVAQQSQYLIGMYCIKHNGCMSPEAEAMTREAYRRAGLQVSFTYLPLLRDLKEANSGIIDGSFARSKMEVIEYPNLMLVKTPLGREFIVAFTSNPKLKVSSWADLTMLRVGILRGMPNISLLCEQHGIKAFLFNNLELGFKMLSEGRLDAVVYNLEVGNAIAETHSLTVYPSPTLHTNMLYHVLNRRHALIAPKLAKAFREMLKDGTSARLLGKWASLLPELSLEK